MDYNKVFIQKFTKISFAASLVLCTILSADDGFDDEFEDDEPIQIEQVETVKENNLNIFGSVTASSSYSYKNRHEVSSAKLSTNINLDYKINQDYKFKSVFKAYKEFETNIKNDNETDINEIYLQGKLSSNTDIKIGRQIVVWGKSDNIRITDILNPLDNTAPGMVDIKDLRLGRNMTKLDYYLDKWSISGIILHENRFSKMPQNGSDYFLGNAPSSPSDSIDNSGFALSLNGNFTGEDLSFYYANQYMDNTTYRSNMIGFAYNKVFNSFLFKTEVSCFDNYDNKLLESQTNSLFGAEYNGINDGSLSLEIANKNNDIQYAFRYTQSFINQTLDFTILYSGFGKELEDGGFIRTWLDYDYNDNTKFNFGIIDYIGGDDIKFEKLKDNDRIFGNIQYNF